ncbi:MBL fold metallo-hydrolase [Sphingomonas sp. 36D10-4-7]|uniref:MBL fold metallo-hydrolase n=2 Tax=Sphingomonas corticis TaxID=2722791 RepID=A0ABX1CN12_9SPHN|nr:MBL fold metallo-hydrolase [Sphingomonas corticis]
MPAMIRATAVLFAAALAPVAAPAQSPAQSPAQADARPVEMGGGDADARFAARGFVATRADPVIRDTDGKPVWNLAAYDFMKDDAAPATVHPSLWRHARLLARHGLFRVTDRIYQVRGFDLANLTVVRGARGWIVIDVLSTAETARAAMALVRERLGDRPVSAVVITHSHSDHFGGIDGVLSAAEQRAGTVPVLAPAGFFEEAVSENLVAGPAMQRRASYQFGTGLGIGSRASMGSGIGPALPGGTRGLPRPTREIARDGEEMAIDGVRLRFQLTPGTEAPAEMNVGFPDWKVIDMAENANVTQHNILTPRGAQVRDTRAWVAGLTAAIERNADAEVMIASHGWPRFGRAAVRDYLIKHRDAYAFLHDQTVRWMNKGLTGDEIASRLTLPPALAREWYNRPYYGSLPFNARAVYQFYLGWYDANPVHLAAMAPADAGRRYVAALGGAAAVLRLAEAAVARGEDAWAAELLNRLVLSDPSAAAARALLARCYERMAFASENSLWRNMYLSAARDLSAGAPAPMPAAGAGRLAANLTLEDALGLIAIRLDPQKAGDQRLRLALVPSDAGERAVVSVANAVLTHGRGIPGEPVDATVAGARADLVAAMLGGAPLAELLASGRLTVTGDRAAFRRLAGMLDTAAAPFSPVLPSAPDGASATAAPVEQARRE